MTFAELFLNKNPEVLTTRYEEDGRVVAALSQEGFNRQKNIAQSYTRYKVPGVYYVKLHHLILFPDRGPLITTNQGVRVLEEITQQYYNILYPTPSPKKQSDALFGRYDSDVLHQAILDHKKGFEVIENGTTNASLWVNPEGEVVRYIPAANIVVRDNGDRFRTDYSREPHQAMTLFENVLSSEPGSTISQNAHDAPRA